jgi:hypothetical protein
VSSANRRPGPRLRRRAGSSWAGRALGIQNTAQNAFAAATPPVIAAVIGPAGYPAVFAAVAAFPLLARR